MCDDDDDELNINPPTPCLGKRPQRPKPKGPGRPWGQKPLAHGRTVEGVEGQARVQVPRRSTGSATQQSEGQNRVSAQEGFRMTRSDITFGTLLVQGELHRPDKSALLAEGAFFFLNTWASAGSLSTYARSRGHEQIAKRSANRHEYFGE